jgi:hypothetical protein
MDNMPLCRITLAFFSLPFYEKEHSISLKEVNMKKILLVALIVQFSTGSEFYV